jgi:hypothetical protein
MREGLGDRYSISIEMNTQISTNNIQQVKRPFDDL